MQKRAREKGFTLIELIVVLGLLATVAAIVAPSLSRFSGGRSLQEEARRFHALTQYAANEAIAQSVLYRLWIDPEDGSYGLEPVTRPSSEDVKEETYDLADGLHFAFNEDTQPGETGRYETLFWPDGTIDEQALEDVYILDDTEAGYVIRLEDFHRRYVLEEAESDL